MASTKKYTSTREWLLDKIEEYLERNPHLSESVFGYQAVKDWGVVERLRAGGDVSTRKLDAFIAYMANPNSKEN